MKRERNPGKAYALALVQAERAEARMLRAFHAWEKRKAALRRAEFRLDRAQRVLQVE